MNNMKKNKIRLKLDINNNKLESVILKQYNRGSQWVMINVTENGKPFIFDENDICIFKMKAPDGREIYNDAVIADNMVIIEITQNCCICSGTGEAELNIIDEESKAQIATMNFYVTIEESVYDNEDIEKSDEFGALADRITEADAVISKTNEIIKSTTDAADAATDSAKSANDSADAAADSAKAAKTAKENAEQSMTAAEGSASAAEASAQNASNSADTAKNFADNASSSAKNANDYSVVSKNSATEAYNSKVEAESYAHGGTESRENENVDNAKYYYEQARGVSEGLQGSLLPMGTITFSQLNNSTKQSGYMYNISDEFITDNTFKEGAGFTYPSGTNVYYTADGYWDCLAGTPVTGVKGNAESSYRKGNVNITPANIGLGNVENKSTADLMNLIYPVGSIYMSVNNTNPSTLFGGTWVAWGSGRVPVGVNASDTDFATAEKTGGAKTHILTTDQIPSHKHTVGAHVHGLNSHTHSIPELSGKAVRNGDHAHYGKYEADTSSGSNKNRVFPSYATSGGTTAILTNSAGAHEHQVTIPASTTGVASGNTANSAQFDSGSTGSGSAHNNLQPYITCYMWKRTA